MGDFKKESNVFRILSESVSEGLIIVDNSQTILATNKASEKLFGYQKSELLGKNLKLLLPQKLQSVKIPNVQSLMENSDKQALDIESEVFGLRRDNTQFPVEPGLNPFNLYGNKYVMVLVKDITVRTKAEQNLKHWANIFNESLNEIFICDAKTLKFIDVNQGARDNIGYTLEELHQLTPTDIITEFSKNQFINLIAPLINKTKKKIAFNTFHKRKNESIYPVEVHMQHSVMGDRDTIVAIILDITESVNYTQKLQKTVEKRTKQLQDALIKEKELGELKTKFLSLVSHEFKTPLSGISTSSTLIGKYTQTAHQEKREHHIKTIQSKVKYLNNIINDFLSIERLENGKVNYKFSRFPFSKVIDEVLYDANMHLKEGQCLVYSKNSEEIFLDFDEQVLELMITNLVNNAIKYSSERTKVFISASIKNGKLSIIIKDQGMGIPSKDQKYVFNRYFRAENALIHQGTGIGLNIVKSHLENLGGVINFTSKETVGTTFEMLIPLNNN